MTENWQDIEAIKCLKARYFRFLDTKHWDELEQLFTHDAAINFPEIDVSYSTGRAFVEFARDVMRGAVSVHVGSMPEITLNAADSAEGIWAMTDDIDSPGGMAQSGGKPTRMRGAGHYFERYQKIDGEWKIAAMTLKRLRLDVE